MALLYRFSPKTKGAGLTLLVGMPIKYPLPPRLSSRVGQSITTC